MSERSVQTMLICQYVCNTRAPVKRRPQHVHAFPDVKGRSSLGPRVRYREVPHKSTCRRHQKPLTIVVRVYYKYCICGGHVRTYVLKHTGLAPIKVLNYRVRLPLPGAYSHRYKERSLRARVCVFTSLVCRGGLPKFCLPFRGFKTSF